MHTYKKRISGARYPMYTTMHFKRKQFLKRYFKINKRSNWFVNINIILPLQFNGKAQSGTELVHKFGPLRFYELMNDTVE